MKIQKQGQAALIATVLLMVIMISAVFGVSAVALKEAKVAEENKKSKQTFFAAEAGVEDAVYRLKRGKNLTSSFSITLNGATTTTTVTTFGSTKTVKSTGQFLTAFRASSAALSNSTGVSFHYGVQVGEDGLNLGDGSMIQGNVFSNGDINGKGSAKSRITGNAQAAGNSKIEEVRVNNGASAHSFEDCIVDGVASYVSSFSNCTASSTQILSQNIAPQDFPITQAQITQWENDAAAGGTLSGLNIGNSSAATTGPKKINGNITMGNGSTLTITGTVWVTGTITFGNNAVVRLDPINYGSLSGVLIVDGSISVGNGAKLVGTGRNGSYLMLLSNFGPNDVAIDIGNTASSTIFYAPNGTIHTGNNLTLREATGRGLDIGNGATIIYENGLANVNFTSGPSGGWDIINWGEIVP